MNYSALLRRWYHQLAEEPHWDIVFIALLLAGESHLGRGIICHVSYTEIDWQAYMQQVQIWQNAGERDYRNIYGGTGPLVYPAGFLWLFGLLRCVTQDGTDIRMAQYIFLFFYLAHQLVVLLIYQQNIRQIRQRQQQQVQSSSNNNNKSLSHEIWSWRIAMVSLCLSKRIHSIFLLRLFNDGPTMLLLYTSVLLFTHHQWNAGCLLFSVAVSLKMNVLLWAPGLLLLLLQVSADIPEVVGRLVWYCAVPQLVIGAQFLTTYPVSYLRKAFELDRTFFYEWTVNWKVRWHSYI